MKQGNKAVNTRRPGLALGLASVAVILSISACDSDALNSDALNGEDVDINISTNDDGEIVVSIDDNGIADDAGDDDDAIDDDAIDDDAIDDDAIGGDTEGPVELTPGDCPLIGNLQSLELATNECQISGVLTEDATLTADRTWFCLLYTSPEPTRPY